MGRRSEDDPDASGIHPWVCTHKTVQHTHDTCKTKGWSINAVQGGPKRFIPPPERSKGAWWKSRNVMRCTGAGAVLLGALVQYMGGNVQAVLPESLTNFQNEHKCDPNVLLGEPRTVEGLQNMVRHAPKVRAVGSGHSWWGENFCASDDSMGVGISMKELDDVQSKIYVDEESQTVTVAAGVTQRNLLDHLANYGDGPGWTLPAFSWFIDQTIGGAVATNTHGTSLEWSSLSSPEQLLSMRVVLANGTLVDLSDETYPHLMRAMRVNVGRLGAVTELTFHIVPQQAIRRKQTQMNFKQLVDIVKDAQEKYNDALEKDSEIMKLMALNELEMDEALWFVPTDDVRYIEFERLEVEPLSVSFNDFQTANEDSFSTQATMDGEQYICTEPTLRGGSRRRGCHNKLPPRSGITSNPEFWSNSYLTVLRDRITPGTFASRDSFLTMSEPLKAWHTFFNVYEQYEFAVPMSRAGDCLESLNKILYTEGDARKGFRAPALVRFIGAEDIYLSNSYGEPVMFINIEDHISHNTNIGNPYHADGNPEFKQVVETFLDTCQARMHWGKSGWDGFQPCYDGTKDYPKWCDFGCAVKQLDPENKFSGTSNVFEFRALKNGQEVCFC